MDTELDQIPQTKELEEDELDTAIDDFDLD